MAAIEIFKNESFGEVRVAGTAATHPIRADSSIGAGQRRERTEDERA